MLSLLNIKHIICSILLIGLATSCNNKKTQFPANKLEKKDSTSIDMIKLNQLLIEVELKNIQEYLDSSSLNFTKNKLGYLVAITKNGSGKKINKNDLIEIRYQVETLKGDTCYTYTNKQTQLFAVGKLEKQRGFNEALTHLKEGDEATIIVPSNLAYGAIGDLNSIPPRATLLYKIYSIKNKK